MTHSLLHLLHLGPNLGLLTEEVQILAGDIGYTAVLSSSSPDRASVQPTVRSMSYLSAFRSKRPFQLQTCLLWPPKTITC